MIQKQTETTNSEMDCITKKSELSWNDLPKDHLPSWHHNHVQNIPKYVSIWKTISF